MAKFPSLVLLLAIALSTELASADCPLNTIRVMSSTFTTRDAAASYTHSKGCVVGGVSGSGHASAGYDLRDGTANASGQGSGDCQGIASGSIHDVYTLSGPPSQSPIVFSALLEVFALADGNIAGAGVTFTEGTSNSQSAGTNFGRVETTLELVISRGPGESFDLHLDFNALGGPGSGGGSIALRLRFADLAPGYVVTSCQGYISDPSVPAGVRSWGNIKAAYR